jgi:hypothetical protein
MFLAATMLLVATSCGGDDDEVLPEATTLPLHDSALAVGGDVQAQAEDVLEVEISEEELERLAGSCADTLLIPVSDGDECPAGIPAIGELCGPKVICLRVYRVSEAADFALEGYIEVTDTREGESLCAADPAGVCMRIGLETAEVLDEIVLPTGSPAETGSPTDTESPDDTEGPTGTTEPPGTDAPTGNPSDSTTNSS